MVGGGGNTRDTAPQKMQAQAKGREAALLPVRLCLLSQLTAPTAATDGCVVGGNVQGITAHHLCRGAQVQVSLRHQGRETMQVPRVIVDQRQHR